MEQEVKRMSHADGILWNASNSVLKPLQMFWTMQVLIPLSNWQDRIFQLPDYLANSSGEAHSLDLVWEGPIPRQIAWTVLPANACKLSVEHLQPVR